MSSERESISLEDVYDLLKGYHLTDSLFNIGVINSAFKYGFYELTTDGVSNETKAWLDKFPDLGQRLSLYITLTRTARFLLVSKAHDYKKQILSCHNNSLPIALNLVGHLHDTDVEGKRGTSTNWGKVLGRISQSQFPLQTDRRVILGRGLLLFVEIPKQLDLPYKIDEKLVEHFNISPIEFISSGLTLWITTKGSLKDDLIVEVESLKQIVTQDNIKKFIELSSGTPEEYRKFLRGSDWKKVNKLFDIYGFEPFIRIPLIKINRSSLLEPNSYVVPQPYYLIERASSGIFYLLADKEREIAEAKNSIKTNDFRRTFGLIYREYVGLQLKQAVSPTITIDLDTDFEYSKTKPDFALIIGTVCILFEVKTVLLKIDTRTFFEEEKIRNEVNSGAFKKAVSQLDEFKNAIINDQITDPRFSNVSTVIKVIVGYEDIFTANSILIPMLKDHHGIAAKDLQIATISDIEAIGNAIASGINIADILTDKLNSTEKVSWSIASVIDALKQLKEHNPLLMATYNNFMNSLVGEEEIDS